MRESWINLNGRWRFTFDPQNSGEQQRWDWPPGGNHPQAPAAGTAHGDCSGSPLRPGRRQRCDRGAPLSRRSHQQHDARNPSHRVL